MEEVKKSGFIKEFKEFISRGNIVDMAVGVIVGGAFTTIVNTVVQSIFTPLINYVIYLICGGNAETFSGLDIILIPAVIDEETQTIITEATILGFSDLVTAVINFLLIAFTLFCVVKFINRIRRETEELQEKLRKTQEEKTQKEEETA